MNKFILFLIVFGIYSCNDSADNKIEEKDSTPELVSYTTTERIEIKDSIIAVPDTIMEESALPKSTAELRLLVIENCGALWPKPCIRSEQINYNVYIDTVRNYFGTDDLISIGQNGIQSQKLMDPYCMRGECGGSQIALKPKNKECHGVIGPRNFLKHYGNFDYMTEKTWHERPTVNGLGLSSEEYVDSMVFMNPDSTMMIQLGGVGYIQENQWPMMTLSKWRLIIKQGKDWLVTNWNFNKIQSTNQPRPILVSRANNNFTIIWWHGQGICCPSDSRAWITHSSYKNGNDLTSVNGDKFRGGLGQPCD